MHQLFLGVGKDLITFFYEQMRAEHKSQLNETLSRISLPKELKKHCPLSGFHEQLQSQRG